MSNRDAFILVVVLLVQFLFVHCTEAAVDRIVVVVPLGGSSAPRVPTLSLTAEDMEVWESTRFALLWYLREIARPAATDFEKQQIDTYLAKMRRAGAPTPIAMPIDNE